MKRFVKSFSIIMVVVMTISMLFVKGVFADDENEEGPVSFTFSNENVKTQEPPRIDAGAAVVMEAESGRVLYSKNPTVRRSIASTTKIMTAILAIENGSMEDNIEISKAAANTGGSSIGVREKQVYTLNELLYGMMLNSGNDAAVAIAEHIGGTVKKFAEMMNSKAREIGASDSVFVTPHGLDTEGQYSTAYDLAIITRYALKNQFFRKIVSTKSAPITGMVFYNTNELLDLYPGADGVKTGYTGKAGRCLVTTAARGDMRLISVVLGCSTRTVRAVSSTKILDYAYNNYQMYKLVEAGQNFGRLPVWKGKSDSVEVRAEEAVNIPLSSEEYEQLEKKVYLEKKFTAPIYAGIDCGYIQFQLDGVEIAGASIKTWKDVERKTFFDYLGEIVFTWSKMMREGIFM